MELHKSIKLYLKTRSEHKATYIQDLNSEMHRDSAGRIPSKLTKSQGTRLNMFPVIRVHVTAQKQHLKLGFSMLILTRS